MSDNQFKHLIDEIKREYETFDQLNDEIREIRDILDSNPSDNVILRAIGGILHDFYTCIERIFEKILKYVDKEDHMGRMNWHSELLNKMAQNVPKVRIPVISDEMMGELHEYLKFRHKFRHSYGFDLKWDKMRHLAKGLSDLQLKVKQQLNDFINFLEILP